jgi:hypothetical protein
MEKLTLDQLEVDNFAMQVSEEELSNLKGGSSVPCASFLLTLYDMFFAGKGSSSSSSSSSSSTSSEPYLRVTDSTAVQVIRGDTTYFHSHTYQYGTGNH